ncbi:MAG: TonB-dependent receptor [Candidatus Binatia bacterium]
MAMLVGVLAVGLLAPATGRAQAAKGKKASAAGVEVEEITVTAQKREENIQETPISVTAISGSALAEKGVTNVVNLGEAVPNLRVSPQTTTQSGTVVTIRGTSQANTNPVFQPAVGLYVDGAYISQVQGSNIDVEDLERVEVLRGPQGTLFGRNTIGGAVNFVTKKPTEDRSIYTSTQVGNFNTFNERVTLNVPLVGKNGFFESPALGTISVRQNVAYKHRDGYFDNVSPTSLKASGSSSFDNLNRVFSMTALRWQPTKSVTIDYSLEYHRYRDNARAAQLSFIYPGSVVSGRIPAFDLTPYVRTGRVDAIGNNSPCMRGEPLAQCNHRLKDDGNHRMHILTGAWDLGEVGPLGKVTLRSISEYRSFTHQSDTDIDGSPIHLADFGSTLNVQHWSEELQWVGAAPRVNYILGAYYYGEYSDLDQSQVFFGNASVYQATPKTKSYAPFGQITVTPPILNDRLSITGGIRYTAEQVHIDRGTQFPRNPAANWTAHAGTAFNGSDGLSPMANVAFQWTDNLMTYFRVARGFKGGGYNGTATNISQFLANKAFGPETLLQYELGFKSQWFDNRLRLNADGFFSDYKDLQVSVFRADPVFGSFSLIKNAGKAEIWGSEVEGTVVPLRGFEITAGYSLTLPKYTEFGDEVADPKNPGKTISIDVSDKRSFNYTPEHQATLGVTYTAPATSVGVFSAHMDLYWQDKVVFAIDNTTAGAQADEAANYALVNGRLQFADIPLAKGSLDLAVFGRNLFDKKYRNFGIDFSPAVGWSIDTYGPPRTFGLELAYNFSAAPEAVAPPPAPVVQAPAPPPAKKKIVLRSVHFDFDKATLKADAKPILDEAVQVLRHEGSVDIVVEGHTDSVGSEHYNLGLSRRRADTVRRYLVDHGIAASRITAEGMGESKPVASNDTADGRAQNRRVELHVK